MALSTPSLVSPAPTQAFRLARTHLPLVPGEDTSCLEIADVTGDSHADVLVGVQSVGAQSGRLLVFAGDGYGGLGSPLSLDLGAPVQAATTGDLTGNGTSDVALIAGDAIAVVADAGGVPRIIATLAAPASGSWIRAFDVDGDHAEDIVAGAARDSGVNVFRGDGRGNFRPSRVGLRVEIAGRPVPVDLNGDDRRDLVALLGDSLDAPLGVALARGGGRFWPARPIAAAPRDEYFNYLFAAADFDRDGHSDVLSTSVVGIGSPWTLGFHRGRGDGRFDERKLVWADDDLLNGLEIGDVNSDGRPDAAIGTQHMSPFLFRHAVGWLQGDGHGGFAARTEIWFNSPGGAFDIPRAGDLDEDGRLDVVSLRRDLVVATGLAHTPLAVAAHAPRQALAGATYHLSVKLRTAASVTVKLTDRGQTLAGLGHANLPAGRGTMDIRFPRRSRGLKPGRYLLQIHAYRNPVTTSRELPIRLH